MWARIGFGPNFHAVLVILALGCYGLGQVFDLIIVAHSVLSAVFTTMPEGQMEKNHVIQAKNRGKGMVGSVHIGRAFIFTCDRATEDSRGRKEHVGTARWVFRC